MAKGSKKKKKAASLSWCWYCDREFEDAKVLLQHQKAKHFRCPHCPRRLNTAGGLAVHIDQVHKLGTDRIENALPGRDSFDIEIYGMEGIPAGDLAAWKKRKAEEAGETVQENRVNKKPKYPTRPLTAEEIRVQLAAHRALMSDKPMAGTFPPPGFPLPPPGMLPPGIVPPPPGFVPPPGLGAPFIPPAFGLPPGSVSLSSPFMLAAHRLLTLTFVPQSIPPPPPGVVIPGLFPPPAPGVGLPVPPPGSMPFPPPGFPAGLPFPPPPGLMPPPPGVTGVPIMPSAPSSAPQGHQPAAIEVVESSAVTLKPGTLLVYGDNEVSLEEKRAKLAQYKVAVDDNSAGGAEQDFAASEGRKRARATDFIE